jgi:hypothetical protein
MHHKRKKAKNARAGCLCCKPWKSNGCKGTFDDQTWQEKRARISEKEQRKDLQTPA